MFMKKRIMYIFVLICIIFFVIFYYIFLLSGNNINRNQKEFVEEILKKFKSYEANLIVLVNSNKNNNEYKMYQEVNTESSKLVVNNPQNVNGLCIELKENKLIISNEKTKMQKVYENYNNFVNESIFLNTFIEDYENNKAEIEENEQEIIVKLEMKDYEDTYIKFKELYINKKSEIPTKLIIKDNNQSIKTSIIYTDMKIK